MSAAITVSDYIQQAEDAVKAGTLEDAEKFLAQAEALQKVNTVKAQVVDARLPLPDMGGTDAPRETATDIATKSWYSRQYGDAGVAMDQVMSELYGQDHRKLAWAKTADFIRYLRTGQYDHALHRTLLYSPQQIMDAVSAGKSVAELKATQVESQDTLGGYLVPEDFRDRIVERLMGETAMRKIAEVITTSRDRVTMPVGTGGDDRYTGAARTTWVDEVPTAGAASTGVTFGQITVPVHTLMADVAVSKNLLEDSQGATSIMNYLQRQFSQAVQLAEDEAFLVGDGVGKPLGIITGATGAPVSLTYGTITSVNSGAGTALTGDAFRNLPYALAAQYRRQGGMWVAARGSLRVLLTLKDGNGNYLWGDRNQQLLLGQPQKIEGFPIVESEVLTGPTTNNGSTYTANVYPIFFVTKGSYLIVDRVGMDVTRYDDGSTARTNTVMVVARHRVGGQPILPWGIAVMKVSA